MAGQEGKRPSWAAVAHLMRGWRVRIKAGALLAMELHHGRH